MALCPLCRSLHHIGNIVVDVDKAAHTIDVVPKRKTWPSERETTNRWGSLVELVCHGWLRCHLWIGQEEVE
jgi:hypothetical protein